MIRCFIRPEIDRTAYLQTMRIVFGPPTRNIDIHGGAKSDGALMLAVSGELPPLKNKPEIHFQQGKALDALVYGFVIYSSYIELYKLMQSTDLWVFKIDQNLDQMVGTVIGSLKQWLVAKNTVPNSPIISEVWDFFKGEGFE